MDNLMLRPEIRFLLPAFLPHSRTQIYDFNSSDLLLAKVLRGDRTLKKPPRAIKKLTHPIPQEQQIWHPKFMTIPLQAIDKA
ncbi:hypothetical protein NDI43_09335 [Microcoleus vaginatus GB2-A3]|uniref:hypothetical protein n=1 Tax=Microcoleus vaginatus TaxID=119532 RepID=UPI0032AAA61F